MMRQRNPVIDKMVHLHLVWIEDLNEMTTLVIHLIMIENLFI